MSQRLRMLITRGVVVQAVLGAARTMLNITGLAGEAMQNIPLLFPYGMSALPKGGAVILLQVGGSRSNLNAICADDPSLRITDLQPGEFGFRDSNGQQIVFRVDRIEVTTPLKLVANVTGDCDLTVGGNCNVVVTGNASITATGTATIDGSSVILGDGGKKIVLDGDPVSGGVVHSSATKSFAQ